MNNYIINEIRNHRKSLYMPDFEKLCKATYFFNQTNTKHYLTASVFYVLNNIQQLFCLGDYLIIMCSKQSRTRVITFLCLTPYFSHRNVLRLQNILITNTKYILKNRYFNQNLNSRITLVSFYVMLSKRFKYICCFVKFV